MCLQSIFYLLSIIFILCPIAEVTLEVPLSTNRQSAPLYKQVPPPPPIFSRNF